jgi:hypothetical protein
MLDGGMVLIGAITARRGQFRVALHPKRQTIDDEENPLPERLLC